MKSYFEIIFMLLQKCAHRTPIFRNLAESSESPQRAKSTAESLLATIDRELGSRHGGKVPAKPPELAHVDASAASNSLRAFRGPEYGAYLYIARSLN